MHSVVLDIEIAKEVPTTDGKLDWEAAKRGECGLSVAVIWDSKTERYYLYDMHTIQLLCDHLEAADLVIGFNTDEFDIPIIEKLADRKLVLKGRYDILQKVWAQFSERQYGGYKLADIVHRTLGLDKTGQGDAAPRLAAEGRYAELFDYCLNDVYITLQLWRHIEEHGHIIDRDGHELPLP